MKNPLRRLHGRPPAQRGGTFLGLVLGLVFGLGIALAVAVYVTKVPVPFINKGQSRSGEQDAAEAKKNKDWDPNVLIQGKNPVRPAAAPASAPDAPAAKDSPGPTVTFKVDTKPDAKPDTKADPKPDTRVDAKADAKPAEPKKPAVTADPLGDLARAKSASSSADPFTYMVQTGAFRAPDEAESQRAKLALMGVDVKVSEREQSGRTVYRVRAGPFERKEDAERAKDRLESSGFETVLVRIQR